MASLRSLMHPRFGWAAGGAGAACGAVTVAALLLSAAGPAAATAGGSASSGAALPGGSFTYQGLRYAATGLLERAYPGQRNNSGTYWIVSYSITDTASTPMSVPASEVPVLFGPGGAEIAADTALSGQAPSVINPGITFSSYEVFNVPASASPSAYSLGFYPYQIVGGVYYAGTRQSMAVPANSSGTERTTLDASYQLENVFSTQTGVTSEQTLRLADVVRTTSVAPDLSAGSFDPGTSFWVVDFALANTTSGDIAVNAGDFALDVGAGDAIVPSSVANLPGWVPPTALHTPAGVTVLSGATFSGSLLFALPAGTPTGNPRLQFTANGQTRIVSLSPCAAGACPPVLG